MSENKYSNLDLGSVLGETFPDENKLRLEGSMRGAVSSVPAQEAEINQISRKRGLHRGAVRGNLPKLSEENKYEKIDIDAILSAPKTAKYLQDPDNAKLAHKDVENLASIERGFFDNAVRKVGSRSAELAGQLLSFINQSAVALEEKTNLAGNIGGIVFDGYVPSWVGPEEFKRKFEQAQGNLISSGAEYLKGQDFGSQDIHTADSIKEVFNDPETGALSVAGEVLLFAAEQGIASIPDMVAVIANLPAYVLSRSSEIGETRAKFKGEEQTIRDTLEAAPFAIASAVLEKIMPQGVLDTLTEESLKLVGKSILKEAVKKGSVEAATEFLQEGVIEYVGERIGTGADMDVEAALERGAFGALAGGPSGAVLGGGSYATRIVVDRVSGAINKGTSEQQKLTEIFEGALKSLENPDGLINLDPGAFRELVKSQTEEGSVHDVYISADAAKDILNQMSVEQIDLPAFKKMSEQIEEAMSLGADVVIPIEDVLTDILPDTEAYTAMLPWMRLSSDSMVESESERDAESIDKRFQDLMVDAEKRVESSNEITAMKKALIKSIKESDSIGPEAKLAAESTASVIANMFAVNGGKDANMAMSQFVEEFKFSIQGTQEIKSSDVTLDSKPTLATDQNFSGITLKEEVELEGTGEKMTIEQDADKLFRQTAKRRDAVQMLRTCLNG